MESPKIDNYTEFWLYYLREHSRKATRAWHYLGTVLAITLMMAAIATQTATLALAAVVSGYFFAWVSHGAIEKNKPATFTYPLWSLASDFRMLFCFLTGRMEKELEKAGIV